MRSVKVDRATLLEALKKNRADHANIVKEAQAGYRTAMIAELDRMLKEAQEGKGIRRHFSSPVPVDHTRDYDRVIRMLEMTVETVIEVTEQDFNAYVLDQWGWMASALMSNGLYAASAMRKADELGLSGVDD